MSISETKIQKNSLVLSLGSNLGNRMYFLIKAEKLLSQSFGDVILRSSVYETAPWGKTDQAIFLNMALVFEWEGSAEQALNIVNDVEAKLGRERHEKWGPRKIDIDILYFGDRVIQEEGLVVPHPEIADRDFVLLPLAEIIPDIIHPVLGKSQSSLLIKLKERGKLSSFKKIEI
ncbi:2-amino-4-hydroxy-6-hydroxymethyldihydropteridine diphosphokinase [bacterium]|nr:2-amino-4-hydroxy-6-hydroxymethyldihydropteridine diphosphokinase [bacterium]